MTFFRCLGYVDSERVPFCSCVQLLRFFTSKYFCRSVEYGLPDSSPLRPHVRCADSSTSSSSISNHGRNVHGSRTSPVCRKLIVSSRFQHFRNVQIFLSSDRNSYTQLSKLDFTSPRANCSLRLHQFLIRETRPISSKDKLELLNCSDDDVTLVKVR